MAAVPGREITGVSIFTVLTQFLCQQPSIMIRRLCLLLYILSAALPVQAQKKGTETFGNITPEDRLLMTAPGDSSAEAYVLYDHLDLSFQYVENQGPVLLETYHHRLKLLKPSSFVRANLSVPYDRAYQEIDAISAVIHQPDGGAYKLSSGDFLKEKRGGTDETVKFTFPRVAEGAIIEYQYTLRTNSIMLPKAYVFQSDIPVRRAEYTAVIPPYYRYVSLGAPGRYAVNEVKVVKEPWGPNFMGATAYSGRGEIELTDIHWAMVDVPAYEYQPYSNNFRDYIPTARLQLQAVQYPGQPKMDVFNDWDKTVKELNDRKDFGRYYRNKSNYNKLWKAAETTVMAGTTDKERIDAAYNYITTHLDWNGDYYFLATRSPNDFVDKVRGNSADLNICLLALLNEAGIEAYPLLVSLRDGGAPIEAYPLLTQFNHLMVYTQVDGKPYLLDANDNNRPPGLPRIVALNHRGWVADENNPRWVDVEVPKARQAIMADIKVGETGNAAVTVKGRVDSYFAFAARDLLGSMTNESEGPIMNEIVESIPETSGMSHKVISGADDARLPLTIQLEFEAPTAVLNGEYLYVQPVLIPMLSDQLDDVDTRLYPIDFAFPWQRHYVANISVPAGFVLEDLPEAVRIKDRDGGISATYKAEVQPDGSLILVFTVDMERTVYPAEAYDALRQVFHRIIELQGSPIVYKRSQ